MTGGRPHGRPGGAGFYLLIDRWLTHICCLTCDTAIGLQSVRSRRYRHRGGDRDFLMDLCPGCGREIDRESVLEVLRRRFDEPPSRDIEHGRGRARSSEAVRKERVGEYLRSGREFFRADTVRHHRLHLVKGVGEDPDCPVCLGDRVSRSCGSGAGGSANEP